MADKPTPTDQELKKGHAAAVAWQASGKPSAYECWIDKWVYSEGPMRADGAVSPYWHRRKPQEAARRPFLESEIELGTVIRNKETPSFRRLIVEVNHNMVVAGEAVMSFKTLYEDWTLEDGSLCGVVAEDDDFAWPDDG